MAGTTARAAAAPATAAPVGEAQAVCLRAPNLPTSTRHQPSSLPDPHSPCCPHLQPLSVAGRLKLAWQRRRAAVASPADFGAAHHHVCASLATPPLHPSAACSEAGYPALPHPSARQKQQFGACWQAGRAGPCPQTAALGRRGRRGCSRALPRCQKRCCTQLAASACTTNVPVP
jgi:hypothetical protein